MYDENELAQTIPSQNPIIDAAAATGRKGDTMMAHVTPGDYVIPKDILVKHPEFLVRLKKAMADEHEDYRTHMVGSGFENINPNTGSPEFGFGRSFKSAVSRVSTPVASTVTNITGSPTAGAVAGGVVGGVVGGVPTAGIGAIPGFMTGMRSAEKQQAGQYQAQAGQNAPAPYSPTEMKLPSSLQELGGLTDQQKRAYLASQGAQGEGLGGSARDYYVNLLQRNIQANPNQSLLPVESQYLSMGGINSNLTGQSLIDALRGF